MYKNLTLFTASDSPAARRSLAHVIIIGSGCNSGSGGWSCCSSSNQCSSGEGDCDNDSHCSGVLKCGTDNCGPNFPTGFDCCILPTIVG